MLTLNKETLTLQEIRLIFERTRLIVRKNAEEANQLFLSKPQAPINDGSVRFDVTGAIVVPSTTMLGAASSFFLSEDRTFCRTNGMLDLRGPRYLIALDANITISHKFDILAEDFRESQKFLRNTFNDLSHVEALALMDYSKNSIVTIFNALVDHEKMGLSYVDDEYLNIRVELQNLLVCVVCSFYNYLAGNCNCKPYIRDIEKYDHALVLALRRLKALSLDHLFSARAIAEVMHIGIFQYQSLVSNFVQFSDIHKG